VTPNEAMIKEVIWSTSNPFVAVVDSKGKVTGKAEGKASITATTVDGPFVSVGNVQSHVATFEVTVYKGTKPLKPIQINQTLLFDVDTVTQDCSNTDMHETHIHEDDRKCWAWDANTKTLTLNGFDLEVSAVKP